MNKGIRPFFVVGYPRSRTTWLSAFLTCPPHSFCFHDALLNCSDPADLVEMFRKVGTTFAGNADSATPFFIEQILKAFGSSIREPRFVFVHRPLCEARESFKFEVQGSKLEPHVDAAFVHCESAVKRMTRFLAAGEYPVINVDFEELNDVDVARSIWNFCVPGVPFHRPRWELLNGIRMNPVSLETQPRPELVAKLERG